MEVSLISTVVTILGAGLAAYIGVRVAIAEIKNEIRNHSERLEAHEERIKRLEQPYFK